MLREMRVVLSNLSSRLEELCSTQQAHTCHVHTCEYETIAFPFSLGAFLFQLAMKSLDHKYL